MAVAGRASGKAKAGGRCAPAVELRAVLFDLDNTLIDFLRLKRQASDAAGRAMIAAGADFPFSAAEVGDILFGEYMGDIEGDDVFEKFLRAHHRQKLRLDQHAVDRITAAAVNAYLKAKLLHQEPYPGVRRTLLHLARLGVKMGVVTDAPRFKAYQRLDGAGLVDFFEFVITHTDHGEHKPHQRPFLEALDALGLPPQAVLMVGDWPDRDMAGAKAVGMRTAWASYGSPPGAEHPAEADFKLERFGDLSRIVGLHTRSP